jgi:hypothetical protein
MRRTRLWGLATLGAAALWVGVAAEAQQGGTPPVPGKSPPAAGGVSGIITEIEPIAATDQAPQRWRLTIKTTDWSDYARDMTDVAPDAPLEQLATQGRNSVSNRGEPEGEEALARIEVGPATNLDARFRPVDDVTNAGFETLAEATGAPRADDPADRVAAKPVAFDAESLKPGLFVQAHVDGAPNATTASRLVVFRPVQRRDGSTPPRAPAAPAETDLRSGEANLPAETIPPGGVNPPPGRGDRIPRPPIPETVPPGGVNPPPPPAGNP